MTDLEKKEIMVKTGLKVKMIRESQSLSLRKLETLAEVDFSQIHRIEKGETSPSVTTLVSIAKGLGINPKDLLDF